MHLLKIEKIGDSLGITLPPEVLEQMNLTEGNMLRLTVTASGEKIISIETLDPDFEKAMQAYHQVSQKYKNALRELAK
ncbi:AbrB/MazE/SpoVT family DNA-binding domain-containing protein [[Phormidium] sp. ETS-05]|uniref:AbrB/MazE/SpoVT family DNA-binding domain-containing protein n=1 Tax=[Phormidium] sp. ETS-05 TaxID=222819 RepID=UPI0018EF03FB|nr:AbrB/MazE/SpoVT family DNA-binding domain-containing protein [[Phormidium] sp. ETS-05]